MADYIELLAAYDTLEAERDALAARLAEWERSTLVRENIELAARVAELERDAARLDYMINERCLVDELEGSFFLSWPDLSEEQIRSFETPREAIDAALAQPANEST